MLVLIGNTVKTDTADYPCKTREEAEALYMSLLARHGRSESAPAKGVPRAGGKGARSRSH